MKATHSFVHSLLDTPYEPTNMKIRLALSDKAEFKRLGWKRKVRGDWELFGA